MKQIFKLLIGGNTASNACSIQGYKNDIGCRKIGNSMKHYVADSPFTVMGESMSAGRLYDKIGDKAKGKVVFVADGGVVCRIINTDKEQNPLIEKEQNSD